MRVARVLLGALLFGCGPPRQQSAFFSFEGSLQGWQPRALDLEEGDGWSITSTNEGAFEGSGSAALGLSSANARGRVWLERTFVLTSPGRHRAHVEFALTNGADVRPADGILAGVLAGPPRTREDLQPAVQGFNASEGTGGLSWKTHSYEFEVQGTSATVVVGLWVPLAGSYGEYLDALAVTFTDD
jgi:hypothetical protein